MKVLILAGGFGTRLSEETHLKPKPMVEIGGMPIIWHIMKHYSSYGFNEFVILLGYKGYVIKEFFSNYALHKNSVTIDLQKNVLEMHDNQSEPWKITLLDTGLSTMTGGRIKRATDHLDGEPFLLTYGDGLSDINITKLVNFHSKQESLITLSAVQPSGRFGSLKIKENTVLNFQEKPEKGGSWINGGFFVCENKVLDYIDDDSCVFEEGPLSKLAQDKLISAKKHSGFWCCMDTLRDKKYLNELWDAKEAPWISW